MTRQNECKEAEMSECMDVRGTRCYKWENVVDGEEKKEERKSEGGKINNSIMQ